MGSAALRVSDTAIGAPQRAWYALQVRANHERTVAAALRLAGIEEYLPQYFTRSIWSDRVKVLARPLFPGYVFGCFDPAAGLPVLAGVIGCLPNNLAPAAVPAAQLESIRIMCESGLPVEPAKLVAGRRVRVERGPLAGAEGVILRERDSWRLVVSVEIFGRAVSVEVDRDSLRGLA